MTDEQMEEMIRDGRLFRCEVCGGVGDYVCHCPDGHPTTTKQDAERVARMNKGRAGREVMIKEPAQ